MSQATPPSIPILHGRYRIEEKLGTGRLAVVYRAYDERLQRTVLVHMLRKELINQELLRQRFIQEAHSSARRSHQSLLEIFDSGEVAGRPYMVTEYVSGRTIRELGALSPDEALLYFRQVVGAVAACQMAGVPHPPITSSNLILVADGHVELLENWMTPLSEVSLDIASYRAPERIDGGPATPASTVYALGLLLYEMLTGRRIVDGNDRHTTGQTQAPVQIPLLSELRPSLYVPSLEQLLLRVTAQQPEHRPANAIVLGQELDDMRRSMNSDTRRLASPPVQMPTLRERINRTASDLIAPRSQQQVRSKSVDDASIPPSTQTPSEESSQDVDVTRRTRSLVGIAVLLLLFGVVSFGAYYVTSLVVNRLFDVHWSLPKITLPALPNLGIDLPEWLTGVPGGGGEVLIVSGAPGLNLRAAPGTQSKIITALPEGTRVRKIGGPQTASNSPWLQVRTTVGGHDVEGWLSANYLKTESGGSPITP